MSWKNVQGRDALIHSFRNVVRSDRLAHAYLFTGLPGIGKKLFATEMAKALFCESNDDFDACDQCRSCVQMDAGSHPDFFITRRPEGKNELPIEQMRELRRRFSLTAVRGRGKFALVDDADDLNEESANCFLKTLEEPPPRSVIVLIGTSLDRQLPTIVSRCQVVRFSPLSSDQIETTLREQGLVDPELISKIVPLSQGSVGNAMAMNDPELWDHRQQWIEALAQKSFPSVEVGKRWMQFVDGAGKETGLKRRRASQSLSMLLSFLQTALRSSVGDPPNAQDQIEFRAIQNLTERLSTRELLELLERCLETDKQIDRYVQLVLCLEALSDAFAQALQPS